jgi:hypothetical protein
MLKLGDLLNLVKYPSLTEKSINLYGDRQYTFIGSFSKKHRLNTLTYLCHLG